MRDNCVLKFSVQLKKFRWGFKTWNCLFTSCTFVYIFIWLTCRYLYTFCFAWSIKFLINFCFRLKHLKWFMALYLSHPYPANFLYQAKLWPFDLSWNFFKNDIVLMSFKFLCDGFFMTLNGMLYFCYRQLVGHNH